MKVIIIFVVTILIVLGFFTGYALGHGKKKDKSNSRLKW